MGNKAEQGDFENSQHKVSLNESGNDKFVDIPSERSVSINDEGIMFNKKEFEVYGEVCFEEGKATGSFEARKEICNFALKQIELANINLNREINVEFNQGMKYVYEFLLKMLEKKNERN